jgi:hypothetical protein
MSDDYESWRTAMGNKPNEFERGRASRDAEVATLTALNADMLAALEQLYTAANLIAYQGMVPMSQGGFIDASKGLAPALMNARAVIAKAKGKS